MTRLRTVTPSMAGWSRQRRGRGFSYLDQRGKALPAKDIERIRSLAIPPAWNEVWICPVENGHIQAIGTDAAGRRQYLYHPDWRAKRDKLKHDRVLTAVRKLPAMRRTVSRDLGARGMPLTRAAAAAVRLLDLGYFRIGSDVYADEHGSFGLTTLEKRHVRKDGAALRFHFVGKSNIEHDVRIEDTQVIKALTVLRERSGGSKRLLAHQEGRRWIDLTAGDVNSYLASLLGGDITAKDFRTWHATVIAAESLAGTVEAGDTKASRQRAIKAAVEEVASYLGNTPTIARKSYIDPRVIDLYESGTVVSLPRSKDPARRQAALEKSVRELLG